jgi:ATP-binding cassette, subfamily B, bacterial
MAERAKVMESPTLALMSMGPSLLHGTEMRPGTARVRRGAPDVSGMRRLPKGLVGRVWREFTRPYEAKLLLMLLAIGGVAALEVVPALLSGAVVDTISHGGPGALARLNLLFLIFLAVAIGGAGLSMLQRWASAWIGEHLILDLRRALYDHVQRMPLAFFTRTQTGALISRLNNDVIGAQRALTGTFGTVVANVVQVFTALGLMFALSWQLTLLVLSVLPLFVILAKRVSIRLQALTRESMELNAAMNTVMTERFNVAGALLVKLFGRPEVEAEYFADKAERVADVGVRSAMVGRLFFVILTTVGVIGTAVVYWIGGRIALTSHSLDAGDVVAFALLVGRAYSPLAALTNAPVDVLTALVSFDRVFEVLDLPHPITDAPDAVTLADARGEVVFDHVWFAYPSAADSSLASLESGFRPVLKATSGPMVLRDVSFRAPPGQTVALVGPSGGGKTTMLSLVSRLYDVSSGAVRIDGYDVRDLTLASLSAAVGVVSQDPHMFHDTVRANLRFSSPDASDAEIEAACRAAQIHDVIAALPDGYETVVGERGYRLSGGERQRLAIARVLLKDPAIVVLDEATSHLDSESEAAVQEALATALAGRTSLVIAHRLSTILRADQILVLDAGRIVQRGAHAELLRAGGLYADLYHTQFAPA